VAVALVSLLLALWLVTFVVLVIPVVIVPLCLWLIPFVVVLVVAVAAVLAVAVVVQPWFQMA